MRAGSQGARGHCRTGCRRVHEIVNVAKNALKAKPAATLAKT
jgi:hypothetical protein